MTLDQKFMGLVLRLAARGRGRTSPNPMVGALVVRGKTIIGRGYHHRAGEAHAEVLALRQAGEKARGATLYVNLEPCNHFGRTPPCTEAILKAGIARVVAGMRDPNPLVSGKGFRRLRRAGIHVAVGIREEECRELNGPFGKFITSRRPWVTLKAAASLDGKVATRSGDSRWITGENSRESVHRLRLAMDAVMVGVGTVVKDDPLLTVRLSGVKVPRQPLRVIVDSRLRIPVHSQIVHTAGKYSTLVATTRAAPAKKVARLKREKIDVTVFPQDSRGKVNLTALMEELARRGVVTVLLEGGPTMNASALREGIVDRLLFFLAPKIIGGEKAPGLVAGEGVRSLKDAAPVKICKVRRSGPDILIEADLRKAV